MRQLFLNDRIILGIIIINACIIFLLGFNLPDKLHHTLNRIDHFITVLFILEVLVKWSVFGISEYFKSTWNTFDFVLTVVAIPSLIALFFPMSFMGDLEFILALRVLRAFKSFRLLQFIPNIDSLLLGVRRALKSSIIIVISLVIYLFTTSILSYYLFHNTAPELFGNPLISLYSIFKVFTIEGWNEIPEQLVTGYSGLQATMTYIFFVIVLLTGGIFGLSLVNSVFVDAMVSDNNDKLESKVDELHQKMNQLLESFDSNKK